MQLVDSKLYIANMSALGIARSRGNSNHGYGSGQLGDIVSRVAATSASQRLLALLLTALLVAAGPALLNTVLSAVSLTLQILLQAGNFGFIAFQIFGR
ncbi:MAG TPA: hypothetical protein VGJ06_02070 [Candidatus Acidoferrum sp.]|jgi:hypothetical protein